MGIPRSYFFDKIDSANNKKNSIAFLVHRHICLVCLFKSWVHSFSLEFRGQLRLASGCGIFLLRWRPIGFGSNKSIKWTYFILWRVHMLIFPMKPNKKLKNDIFVLSRRFGCHWLRCRRSTDSDLNFWHTQISRDVFVTTYYVFVKLYPWCVLVSLH